MSRILTITVAAFALMATATASDHTACRSHSERSLSYASGVEGFRPNENFVREWVREPPKRLVGTPQYYEIISFNGDDPTLTYSYEMDGRRGTVGKPDADQVHNVDIHDKLGASAYIQSFWNRDEKTLMAHIRCNDVRRAEGDCRISFEDARRIGPGKADGPIVDLFLEADAPSDICVAGFGIRGAWWLVLDGQASQIVENSCGGRDLAEAFAKAEKAQAIMQSPYEHNKGQELTNTLGGADIHAALAFTTYVRTLNYARTAEQTVWLEGLISGSKAAFADAGDALRDCTSSEPPT